MADTSPTLTTFPNKDGFSHVELREESPGIPLETTVDLVRDTVDTTPTVTLATVLSLESSIVSLISTEESTLMSSTLPVISKCGSRLPDTKPPLVCLEATSQEESLPQVSEEVPTMPDGTTEEVSEKILGFLSTTTGTMAEKLRFMEKVAGNPTLMVTSSVTTMEPMCMSVIAVTVTKSGIITIAEELPPSEHALLD
jgi:hypothetical protein